MAINQFQVRANVVNVAEWLRWPESARGALSDAEPTEAVALVAGSPMAPGHGGAHPSLEIWAQFGDSGFTRRVTRGRRHHTAAA